MKTKTRKADLSPLNSMKHYEPVVPTGSPTTTISRKRTKPTTPSHRTNVDSIGETPPSPLPAFARSATHSATPKRSPNANSASLPDYLVAVGILLSFSALGLCGWLLVLH